MKTITVLGSTGSIGTQTLDIAKNDSSIKVRAIAACKNIKLLEEQIRYFAPEYAAVYDEAAAKELKIKVSDTDTKVLSGMEGLCEVSALKADMVVTAVSGSIGLKPTLEAIKSGNNIGLANKETMVCAGDLVNRTAKEYNVKILPVDSEHSAIFQCINSQNKFVEKIILTASGGPFFGKTREELSCVTVKEALRHPNWSMGAKITIDSATLINKGLEVIEAVKLFGVSASDIEVCVHRQSIVHSMVEFCDNSVIAQLGVPDMRLPIAYAINYPERKENISGRLDITACPPLTFEKPDLETFEGLALGIKAAKEGGTMTAVYSAANEVAVDMFLKGKCSFVDIASMVKSAMGAHKNIINPDLESILNADKWAREYCLNN